MWALFLAQCESQRAQTGSRPVSGGVITTAQLALAGIAGASITRRLRAGTLHRMYPKVYSIAPPSVLRPEARWLGAVLASGEGAALSHRSAAAFWGLLDDRWGFVDV